MLRDKLKSTTGVLRARQRGWACGPPRIGVSRGWVGGSERKEVVRTVSAVVGE